MFILHLFGSVSDPDSPHSFSTWIQIQIFPSGSCRSESRYQNSNMPFKYVLSKKLIKKFKLTVSVVLFISDALIADFLEHVLYFLISVDTLNWSRVRMDNFKHFVRGHSRFISNRTLNYKMQSYLTDTATYMRFISYRKLKIHIHYTVSLYIYTVYTCTLWVYTRM